MSTLIRGDRLSADLRREVLAKYVHRWTHENAAQTYGGRCPACAQSGGDYELTARHPDQHYPPGKRWHEHHVKLTSDAEWLQEHAFWVTKASKLDQRRTHAEPAWKIETEGGER